MKKEYLKPRIEKLEIDELLQSEVINPGTNPEGEPADTQRNYINFEETEVDSKNTNLWDE